MSGREGCWLSGGEGVGGRKGRKRPLCRLFMITFSEVGYYIGVKTV